MIKGLHHNAYRCRDSEETRAFYEDFLGLRMVSVHNSHMFLKLMSEVRSHIATGTFSEFRREFIADYRPTRRVLLQRAAEAER